MVRLTIFIIALLLAVGTMEPTGAWLVTLAVLSGIEAFRISPFRRVLPPLPGWPRTRRAWTDDWDW
jgi:hypothetical protein